MIVLGVTQKLLKSAAVLTSASSVAYLAAAAGASSSSRFSVMASSSSSYSGDPTKAPNIYGFSALDIDGNEVSMDKYKGHVCVVVNVASQ